MNELIYFLLRVSFCLVLFYLPFIIILSKTTFFKINRIYLLASIILSFILPTIRIEIPFSSQVVAENFVEPIQLSDVLTTLNNRSVSKNVFTFTSIVKSIYFIGVFICIIRIVLSTRHILKLKAKGKVLFQDGFQIVHSSSSLTFTFFNTIFLPEQSCNPQVIQHEKVHIEQLHWIDLLFVEITHAILWFNPMMILIRRSVKLQHEYLADQASVSAQQNLENYLHCMLSRCNPVAIKHFVSPFNFQFIKKRINMLTKQRTSITRIWVYLVLIPITFFILVAFSNRKVYKAFIIKSTDSTMQTELILIAPLKTLKISSPFGNRMHPIFKKEMLHTGIDFITPEGEVIIAPEDGVVVTSLFENGRGNFIVIKHDETFSTSFSHLKDRLVQDGDPVKKGQVIGLVGNTGLSVNTHLHYEVLKNGDPIDPAPFLIQK